MGRALEPVANLQILAAHPHLTFRAGRYVYEITRKDNQSFYTGDRWRKHAFGAGALCFRPGQAGQTYVLQVNDRFYESRLSFYNDIQGLDFTLGFRAKSRDR